MLERAIELKQNLVDFVYDAEGELAVALEGYVAEYGSRSRQDIRQQNLVVDTFLKEGKVGDQTPLDLFLKESNLSETDRTLVENWRRSFTGLFEVLQRRSEAVELMNWLTAKRYTVFASSEVSEMEIARWKSGEILLTRIAPLPDANWMFSGGCIPKGGLGKPKLAVAIGEFKNNYKEALYSDAPELLTQAWDSVAQYHQEFVDFLGSDHITLPGYQLNQKIAELQERLTQKQLAAAGIDPSKSLQDLMQEAGTDQTELQAAATEAGADSQDVETFLKANDSTPMITPKVELPSEIKRAESVTVFSHPRWGQMFIPTYSQFIAVLESEDPPSQPNAEQLVRKYLEDETINAFIWQKLREDYQTQLEILLRNILERPEFNLEKDLEAMLHQFNKPLAPQLPEIASVPQHLHQLFEEAVAQVSQSKSKSSKKKKKAKGFQV